MPGEGGSRKLSALGQLVCLGEMDLDASAAGELAAAAAEGSAAAAQRAACRLRARLIVALGQLCSHPELLGARRAPRPLVLEAVAMRGACGAYARRS